MKEPWIKHPAMQLESMWSEVGVVHYCLHAGSWYAHTMNNKWAWFGWYRGIPRQSIGLIWNIDPEIEFAIDLYLDLKLKLEDD